MPRPRRTVSPAKDTQSYRQPDADLLVRLETDAQAHFKKAKPTTNCRFDFFLTPSLEWDIQNPTRETAEHLINQFTDFGLHISDLAAQSAAKERDCELTQRKAQINDTRRLRGPSGLNWSRKAERLNCDVPTLPLFVLVWLSTSPILDTGANQAFFPHTSAWEMLKKLLRMEFEDAVFDHQAGGPFSAVEDGQIAVMVIDPRGNELL